MIQQTPKSTLFPYTTLFRSYSVDNYNEIHMSERLYLKVLCHLLLKMKALKPQKQKQKQRKLIKRIQKSRSEEHTSELQSRQYLVCRLLLEKKKKKKKNKKKK